jgi:4-amino-4-deoxy-L-arabinose transferase-like glycosyltransferase
MRAFDFPASTLEADGNVGRFRCSVAGLMAVVGLVALDCMAIRTPLSGRSLTAGMLLLGGLPMANILAAGLLPLLPDRSGREGCRPWLVGFQAVGWTALFLYTSCAYYDPDALRESVVRALKSLRVLGNPTFLIAVAAALSVPQLGLALVGGWLNRRYRIGATIDGLFDRDWSTAREPRRADSPRP